jgi:hypothetical protein
LGTALNIGSILSRNAGAVKKRKRLHKIRPSNVARAPPAPRHAVDDDDDADLCLLANLCLLADSNVHLHW